MTLHSIDIDRGLEREKTLINEIFQEAIMDPTQWSKFHAQMGVRIVADQKRWLQEHTSKNPLVNLTNSVWWFYPKRHTKINDWLAIRYNLDYQYYTLNLHGGYWGRSANVCVTKITCMGPFKLFLPINSRFTSQRLDLLYPILIVKPLQCHICSFVLRFLKI